MWRLFRPTSIAAGLKSSLVLTMLRQINRCHPPSSGGRFAARLD
jgi:hypothetical protein